MLQYNNMKKLMEKDNRILLQKWMAVLVSKEV